MKSKLDFIKGGAQRERGSGAAYILLIFAGVAFVWFVFLGIMDAIGSKHQKKVKKRMEIFESYKPKPKSSVKRGINGYQVKY